MAINKETNRNSPIERSRAQNEPERSPATTQTPRAKRKERKRPDAKAEVESGRDGEGLVNLSFR